jgi:hypothetical protein
VDLRLLIQPTILVALLLGSVWGMPAPAHAEEESAEALVEAVCDAEEESLAATEPDEPGDAGSEIASGEDDLEAMMAEPPPATRYLWRLIDEINQRRELAGTPRLAAAPDNAHQGLSRYLADLTPAMLSSGSCFHGARNGVGWDYAADNGFQADAHGEVLACPAENGFWTAERIADGWWSSPRHHDVLFRDAGANVIACGMYGSQRDGSAYLTIACVTYRV